MSNKLMTAFSDHAASSFDGLRLTDIRVLLGLVTKHELRKKSYIKRRYLEHASYFDSTLAFLTNMRLIKDDGTTLSPTRKLRRIDPNGEELSSALLSQFTETIGQWRTELFEYLRNYRICDGKALHRPTPEQRSSESAIRNFLMELAAVSNDSTKSQYILNANCHSLFIQACSTNSVDPSLIPGSQQAKDEIGLAAEHFVVAYEQCRLGPELADRVDHVALRNVAAGFDIQSVTVHSSCEILPRFIEVKAVSTKDFCFYWTANEIAVAQMFGTWYYLYLLPVDSDGQPKTDSLRMLCDPHNAVLKCPEQWSVEANVLQCQLAGNSPF